MEAGKVRGPRGCGSDRKIEKLCLGQTVDLGWHLEEMVAVLVGKGKNQQRWLVCSTEGTVAVSRVELGQGQGGKLGAVWVVTTLACEHVE